MTSRILFAALLGATMLSAPAQAQAPAAAVDAAQKSAHDRLFELFKASDEASLRRNPIQALARGDLRYADRLGNFFSDEYYQAERDAARSELAALAAIDRDSLGPDERVAYDVFKWQRSMDLKGLEGEIFAVSVVRPVDHFNGFHTAFAELSSAKAVWKPLKWSTGRTTPAAKISPSSPLRSMLRCHLKTS